MLNPLDLLNPIKSYTNLIIGGVVILAVLSAVGYHYYIVHGLEAKINDQTVILKQKDVEIVQLKLGVAKQNEAIADLELKKKDLELQIEQFNGQSKERQLLVNKLIDQINKKQIPKDCNGATREAATYFNTKAKQWNQK